MEACEPEQVELFSTISCLVVFSLEGVTFDEDSLPAGGQVSPGDTIM